jgi:CNT family concentrative nucleoside transporter
MSALASLQGLLALLLVPLAVWLASEDRATLPLGRAVRLVGVGIALQVAIAAVLLGLPWSRTLLGLFAEGVAALQRATEEGMRLVFGYLAGGPPPFDMARPEASFLLAFRALPLILVVSALARLLYHWGVLQWVVRGFALLLQRALGIGGPLGTTAAANVFLGPVEAPLLVRPYLSSMSRGALFASMAVGMATIAGTVMALYATLLEPVMPGAAGHILTASLMNVPAALVLARLAVPSGFESGPASAPPTLTHAPQSSMDAIAQGTMDGLRMIAAVAALLVVVVALVALANAGLAAALRPFGLSATWQGLAGHVLAPIAFAIGVPWAEAASVGRLLGEKLVLNELVAYLDLARTAPAELSARSRMIAGYALCSFANLGTLGIMVGGYVTMLPERRAEIAALAPKAVAIGFLAGLMSAAIVGLVSAVTM